VEEGDKAALAVDLSDGGGINTAFEKRVTIAFAAR
jgi:hypothetical protein